LKAIVVATVTGRCWPVLATSIAEYVPDHVEVYIAGSDLQVPGHVTHCSTNTASNFGDAYNAVIDLAFQRHDEIVVANDDMVLDPDTWRVLGEDVAHLGRFNQLGWVACRSNRVRPRQQHWRTDPETAFEVNEISPLFAWISREAWRPFPPINWFSDDVHCMDLSQQGRRHFVSRAYVHHVGSATIGQDSEANAAAAEPWIREHRPALHELWFGKKNT
jgi:hypothetical protein